MPASHWQLDFTGAIASDGTMAWGYAIMRPDCGKLESKGGTAGNALGNCESVAAYMGLWHGLQTILQWKAAPPMHLIEKISGREYCGVMLRTEFKALAVALEESWTREGVHERIRVAHQKCMALLTGELAPYLIECVAPGVLLLAHKCCQAAMETRMRKAG